MIERKIDLPAGFRVIEYPRLGSTNDEACRLARDGAAEGTVVRALEQESGRGRRGRGWASPPGNLYTTTILRPRRPAAEAAQLTFAAALAVVDTARAVLGPGADIRCKWPNDVLCRGAKLAGILLETETDGQGAVEWLVLGVGINVRHFPEDSEYPATSLSAEAGKEVGSDAVLSIFAERLAAWYRIWTEGGLAPVRDSWLERAAGLGQSLRVRLADRTLQGVFAGLDMDGVLLLDRDEGGGRVRVTAGDVFFPVQPEA